MRYIKTHWFLIPLAIPDDEPPVEVRHELEALLLLVRPDDVEALAELLELALEPERERQPAHVGRAPALPEVHHPRRRLRLRVRRLARVRGIGLVFWLLEEYQLKGLLI